jgi:Cdc6-like AAA superfamily ATPase
MDQIQRDIRLGQVFSPAAPVDKLKLFAGRAQQRADFIDAVLQRGRHAVLFGERGVGKTSLSSVIKEFLEKVGQTVLAPRVNCDFTDTFSTIWKKVFKEFRYIEERQKIGFGGESDAILHSVAEQVEGRDVTPDDVRDVLSAVGQNRILIVIIDEFDRVAERMGTLFSDTIKTLSDQSVPATLVLVGVADIVEALIREHESVERALAQIRVPRMSRDELNEIITLGLKDVEMTIQDDARARLVALSQGLPHYTHLVGLYAARNANRENRLEISRSEIRAGVEEAVKNAQESIVATHHRAVMSARVESLYRQVALACALAKTDERGYFTSSSVRRPMSVIMGRTYDIPAFARHMNEFCETTRGPILQKIGTPRNYRFRFVNPLMQPFIIMDGMSKGLIDDDKLTELGSEI